MRARGWSAETRLVATVPKDLVDKGAAEFFDDPRRILANSRFSGIVRVAVIHVAASCRLWRY